MNLCHPLERAASERPDALAIRYPSGQITYKTLLETVQRLARGLHRAGLGSRDRIVVMLPNIPHFVIAYHAILRIGGIVVPADPSLRGHELALLLEEVEASGLIIWGARFAEVRRSLQQIPTVRFIAMLGGEETEGVTSLTKLISKNQPLIESVELDEDEPALYQPCAGSTCRPKAAELSHGALVGNAIACRDLLGIKEDDVLLAALPLAHPIGQTLLMNLAIVSGATLSLYPKFDVEFAASVLKRGEGTVFVSLPTMLRQLCDYYAGEEIGEFKSARLTICGGGKLTEDTLKDFERKFGSYVLECYTQNETGPVCSLNQWRNGRRVGSLGHPLPGVDMKVLGSDGEEAAIGQEGEIAVKGINVTQGYLGRPLLTSSRFHDGWFLTGDLGRMDINGFFYLTGRIEGRLVRGGYAIHASEVEDVLLSHPEVADAVVLPLPDSIVCDEIKACVVLKRGAGVSTEQLAHFCSDRLADYKIPDIIRFYRDLPRDAEGKINSRELVGS